MAKEQNPPPSRSSGNRKPFEGAGVSSKPSTARKPPPPPAPPPKKK